MKRKYAFECDEVPREETQYLKVKYSAKFGTPTARQCSDGTAHIERVFGASSTPLEFFLLKRKLMGPSWIRIKHPRPITSSFSWCKIELGVEDPKFVSVASKAPSPPMTTMCVSMKTVLNPVTHTHEIVAISAVVNTKVEADGETHEDPRNCRR